MKICYAVSAQELLEAGAPLNVIRQSYRKIDGFAEEVVTTEPIAGTKDAKTVYTAYKSAREDFYYTLPAKKEQDGKLVDADKASTDAKVVYGGSIKDSYVLVNSGLFD